MVGSATGAGSAGGVGNPEASATGVTGAGSATGAGVAGVLIGAPPVASGATGAATSAGTSAAGVTGAGAGAGVATIGPGVLLEMGRSAPAMAA